MRGELSHRLFTGATDCARLVPTTRGSCALESWVQIYNGQHFNGSPHCCVKPPETKAHRCALDNQLETAGVFIPLHHRAMAWLLSTRLSNVHKLRLFRPLDIVARCDSNLL